MGRIKRLIGLSFLIFAVSACGGGGSGNSGGGTQPTLFNVSTSTTGTGSGTLSPTSRSVTQGSTTSFTISAGSGSSIAGVSGCGGSLSGTTYTTGPINGNCTVSATFNLNTYTVTANADSGGSISPRSSTVTHGETAVLIVTPSSGYAINAISGCGGSLTGNTYTTGPITAACSVSASFRQTAVTPPPPATFTVTTSTTGTGLVAPGSASVTQGQTASFTLTPGTGSEIESVTGCGGSLSGTTYSTGPISANCQVTVAFRAVVAPPPATYSVTTATGGNGTGTITPGSANVTTGQTASFQLSPGGGSSITSVTGCGGSLSGNTYTTGAVNADCQIMATFSLNSYTVTATAGQGGSISPSSLTVDHGSTASFTVTADTGYSIVSVNGCSGSLDGTTYTTGVITGPCMVSASFSLNTYPVTATAGSNGSISPSSANVTHGDTAAFSVTPSSGYAIDSVSGCGGALSGSTYTTGPITAACTVTASFIDLLAISIESVQLNQSVQDTDGSLPAVAGRPGLLRIVLRADRTNTETPDVRVRLFRDGVQQWERILPARNVGVPTNPALWVETQTWNIALTAAEVQLGVAIEAVADPQQAINLANREATRFPRGSGVASLDVRELAPLELRFIRIQASRHGNVAGNISNDSLDTYSSSTRKWLPVGGIQASLRSASFVTDLNLTSEDNIAQLLSDLRTLRIAEATGREYFHGIMPAINGLAVAGMAYLVSTPDNLSGRVGLSYDRITDASDTVAHELGHNMGRRHAPCNDPSGVDPNFPYADGGIGHAGYDIDERILRGPGGLYDFMGYCRPRWISDYNYAAILDWRRSDPTAFQPVPGGPDPLADALGQPGPGVLIWGRVGEGGVELNPLFSLEARPVLPEAEGAHTVRGFAVDGALLFDLSFAGEAVPHASDPSERHFGFFVPLSPAQIARLQRVELVSPHGVAEQAGAGERAAATADRPAADRVAVIEERLADGGLRLGWDAASRPMAMVRDRHSGAVLGIGRSGELRFSAESMAGAVPEVLLSDGVHTAPGFPVEER
jgi:hypothetical protein